MAPWCGSQKWPGDSRLVLGVHNSVQHVVKLQTRLEGLLAVWDNLRCNMHDSSCWEGLTIRLFKAHEMLPALLYYFLHTGHLFPLEAHLVSVVSQAALAACPPEGCVVVTGVQFELSDDLSAGSAWLEPLFTAMPLSEGVSALSMLAYTCQHGMHTCSLKA